jgi:Putative Ig domain
LRKIFSTLVASITLALIFSCLDSASPSQTANAATALAVSTTSLPQATLGKAYTNTLKATGGTLPYNWKVVSGTHPSGFALNGGTGAFYGTPAKGGSFPLVFSVTDSSKPAQTKNVSLTIVIDTPALSIGTTSLPAGVKSASYSSTLQVTGGTPSYMWSITSGKLPSGLTLAAQAGSISGKPSVTGTFPITFAVRDSSSPDLTKSASLSIVIGAVSAAAPALSITSSTLASGTDGTAYSSQLKASGGTPAYTWSITSGKLPAGLTLAATTGMISGTPSATGTSSFTATVTDNSNPDQTKSAATSITVAVATAQQTGPGTTWYIRADGGTNTQCTGKTNAAYPGSGSGQACAFNHPYQMLDSSGNWANFAGGDTIQFADPASASHTYYMGEQNSGVGTDWSAQISLCAKGANNGTGCILPAPPSGTASQHTRILGQNAGNCHDSAHTHLVNPTVLSGIDNAFAVLDTRGTNYVDISCIEVTQPDTCTTIAGPGQCSNASNYVHYGGIILNYLTEQGPSNLTLQDVAVVGLAGSGILGSHLNKTSSDVFSATDVYVIGNGQAGWNGDGGGCDTSCETVGTMNLSHAMIDWNGCVAVKPYDMTKPDTQNAFNYCYGQESGGYGDGFVQVAAGNMTLNVDHSFFRWNTQDGFDSLHLSDDVKTSPAIHISTSWSEGNAGQTFKLGAGSASSAINNVSISNCRVLATASNFPNNPSGWALDNGDTCRAAGDQWAFQLNNGTAITLENNTSVGYGTTMYDVECAALAPNCAANGATFIFRNNISKGYPDPANDGLLASGFFMGAGNVFSNAGSAIDHNLWNTMNTGCPDVSISGGVEKIYTCGDPDLVGESNINAINPNITSSSPAINSGIAISGITTDYNGNTRPNPPAIGATEP